MSWILLEGLDRSGKSSVAEYYKKQGYEVVHMSAPDKRYFQPGYSGPSYLEEVVEMYNVYAGKDVVFDRTPYGELIWPEIFNRMPLLNEEDYEYLQQLEYNQGAEKYLMTDDNTEAHWKRCVENNEPINRIQFVTAGRLYDKLTNERGFERKHLGDFSVLGNEIEQTKKQSKAKENVQKTKGNSGEVRGNVDSSSSNTRSKGSLEQSAQAKILSMEEKIDKANAIKALLSSRIVKKKGGVYDDIEANIRSFLGEELEAIFSGRVEQNFSESEIQILKAMAQRVKSKME